MNVTLVFPLAVLLSASGWAQDGDILKAVEELAERQRRLAAETNNQLQELARVIDELKVKIGKSSQQAIAAAAAPAAQPPAKPAAPPRWFEKFNFRGYTQFRHNRVYTTNPDLLCESCDRNAGMNTNLSFRRARFILNGDINDRLSFYFQPDFAASSGNLHFGQIRDLYFDLFLDHDKEWRIRAGQSKVPYGFENLQSSQNRLALDRADSLNTAVPNERDLGLFAYWAPREIRARLAALAAAGPAGLKGSGDYGVVAFGVTNGQSSNRPEANNDLHYFGRLAYPWKLRNQQHVELGIQAYTGFYSVTSDQRSTGTLGRNGFRYPDQRLAGSLVWYPEPFGLQAEYNFGTGPEYDPSSMTIKAAALRGGYVQAMFRGRLTNGQALFPFARYQYYDGGKKIELDAAKHRVRETEIGLEWHRNNLLELTGSFVHSDRTVQNGRTPFSRQIGSYVRVQLQVNY